MVLHIKYMVSYRCKILVREILKRGGIHCISVQLGWVETIENVNPSQYRQIQSDLLRFKLELITDKKDILIEQIKTTIIELIHNSDEQIKINYSNYLSKKLKYNYTYLSNVFSLSEGITLEHFIIIHKIARVKELITYDELNITEIAFKLHYSSVAHLSNQFKKETGITTSYFRSLKEKNLINIENL